MQDIRVSKMKNPKVGDIIEIRTSSGFAYAQYVLKNKLYGALLRVFSKVYPSRPKSFLKIVEHPPTFQCFFPLSAALKTGVVDIAGNAPLPEEAKVFPIFRSGMVDPVTRKVQTWWLWDGEKEWRVGELSPEQRRLPIRGVWNDTLLVERIEEGWTPESDQT